MYYQELNQKHAAIVGDPARVDEAKTIRKEMRQIVHLSGVDQVDADTAATMMGVASGDMGQGWFNHLRRGQSGHLCEPMFDARRVLMESEGTV